MSVDQYKKEVGMMNLENLIKLREGVSQDVFPIPKKELLQRFEQLYTGAVNDVLREFCLLGQALPGHIGKFPTAGKIDMLRACSWRYIPGLPQTSIIFLGIKIKG